MEELGEKEREQREIGEGGGFPFLCCVVLGLSYFFLPCSSIYNDLERERD